MEYYKDNLSSLGEISLQDSIQIRFEGKKTNYFSLNDDSIKALKIGLIKLNKKYMLQIKPKQLNRIINSKKDFCFFNLDDNKVINFTLSNEYIKNRKLHDTFKVVSTIKKIMSL